MQEEKIVYLKLDELKPYEKNPRNNKPAVEAVAQSIKDFGFKNPIIVDKDLVIIAGHTRFEACKLLGLAEAPVIIADDLTKKQAKALRLVDNKVAELAEWDIDLLKDELTDLADDYELDKFGFAEVLDDMFDEKEVIEDDIPEVEEEPIAKLGEIYQLGNHRLMCGDSTNEEDIKKLMNGKVADLVFTDPPYGMKKENEGVLNDNLNFDDLLEFNKKWIPLTFKYCKDNGSWYCWGIDEPLMDIYSNILKPMIRDKKISFRNLITWSKGAFGSGGGTGVGQAIQRSYFPADEKCLFVMCGVQGFNNNTDNYYEGWERIRLYLESEINKVNATANTIKNICGCDMFSHWFSKSQWAFITEKHYNEIKDYYNGEIFKKPYSQLRNEYLEIKKGFDKVKAYFFDKVRAYFDNTHDMMTNIWEFNRVKGKERELCGNHATPKPIALCSRAIKSSSRENEIVLDTFGGSGSTLIACEQLNRKCYMMELDPKYVDVIIKRWETLTGKKAVKLN